MKVGDLVTLSAAARKIQDVEMRHKRFFRGPESSHWHLRGDDAERFKAYWEGKNTIVGLITRISERSGRTRWNYQTNRYETPTNTHYHVSWQANPKPLSPTQHRRGHLKFVSRSKKKK